MTEKVTKEEVQRPENLKCQKINKTFRKIKQGKSSAK